MNISRRTLSVFRVLTARLAASRRGAAAVEFALIIPVLSAGIIGVANYGVVVFDKMEMLSALRAGGQLAIYNRTNSTSTETNAIKAAVVASASTDLGLSTAEVTATESCLCLDVSDNSYAATCGASCTGGDPTQYYMTVAITNKNFPLLIAGSIDLTGSVKVRTK
ncbi:MAG: TadE/TadG family type IV pilus assembly protein [Rhodospirillales bacterium]